MSLLRLLSPARAGSLSTKPASASTSSSSASEISLTLRVPSFACIYMTPPDDPLWPYAVTPDLPRDDQLVNGELDILVPPGSGRRKCKAIRVTYRSVSRLNMGPKRGWEEDVIFERKCELVCGTSEGIILGEGLTRLDFTIILPTTLAPHDWHHNGKITHEIVAEVEGEPAPAPLSSAFSAFRRGSHSPSGSVSSRGTPRSFGSRSPSPLSSPDASPRLSPLGGSSHNLNMIRQDLALPQTPSYEQSQMDAHAADAWIKGVLSTRRPVVIFYNPSRTNDHSALDERSSGFLPGLGMYEFQVLSDVFCIGGPFRFRLHFPDLPAEASIAHAQVLLLQTHKIRSPRDDPETAEPIPFTRTFKLYKSGERPNPSRYDPSVHAPIWRGAQAGGKDVKECTIEAMAMMPTDDQGRPSTLPAVVTPIAVEHELVLEVLFYVQGEDKYGKPTNGPAELRIMRVKLPLIVPSCALIPSRLSLPSYDDLLSCPSPCEVCGIPPYERFCHSCPPTMLPHDRHDIPIEACDACNPDKMFTEDSGDYSDEPTKCSKICACGAGIGNLEERMKAFALQGVQSDYSSSGVNPLEAKVLAERGRPRERSRSRTR